MATAVAGKSHAGKKLKSYTIEYKVEAVEWHRKNGKNVSLTANKFGVDRKREWNAKYDQLAGQCHGKQKKKRYTEVKINNINRLYSNDWNQYFIIGGCIASNDLDVAVFEYLEEECSEGRCVRNCDLQEKACDVAASLNLPNFKVSPQWMARWKRRWNVGRRRGTNTSQKVPTDYEEQLL